VSTFCLVHGAWHGGWAWNSLRDELERRGHRIVAPDLPCEDPGAGVVEYATVVREALDGEDDAVVVGHSLGGLTIPLVPGSVHVFLCALVPGANMDGAFAPGFGDARIRDELGRSYYPDAADAARELQYPPDLVALASRLRRQAPVDAVETPLGEPAAYVVCARDTAITPDWQRRVARDVLGVEAMEIDAGHSPMLSHPRELADILAALA
jgi:pimeloyl-ACP methyl ester carboxylesterase